MLLIYNAVFVIYPRATMGERKWKELYPICGFKLLIFMCFTVDDEENDAEFGSASKKRRTSSKSMKLKKPASSRFGYFHIKNRLVVRIR